MGVQKRDTFDYWFLYGHWLEETANALRCITGLRWSIDVSPKKLLVLYETISHSFKFEVTSTTTSSEVRLWLLKCIDKELHKAITLAESRINESRDQTNFC